MRKSQKNTTYTTMIRICISILLIVSGYLLWNSTNPSKTDLPKESVSIEKTIPSNSYQIKKDGLYTDTKRVALYIQTYKTLPPNYISKKEAKKLGWDSKSGNLWDITDKKSIGGDRFLNFEKQLPEKEGRKYYECDIEYTGGFRNSKRLVYSNDGLIFYTDDHYKTFTQLY